MPQITQTLYVTNPKQWREWLVKHYLTVEDVWLIYPNKSSGKPRISYNDAVEEALCFGWIDSIVRRFDETSSVQRFSPRNPGSGYSQANIERLRYLVAADKLTETVKKEIMPILNQEFVFPQDIMEEIKRNKTAYGNFQSFSPTYRRIRVSYVDAARNRPKEFNKRLHSLIRASEQDKQIGFGGIEKYY